jgi:hypothetical protein
MDPKRRRLLVMLVAAEAVILVAIVQVLLPGAGGGRARFTTASASEPAGPVARRFVVAAGRVLSIDDDRSSYRIVPADPDHAREIVVEDSSHDASAPLRVSQHQETLLVTRYGEAPEGRTRWAFGPFVHIGSDDPVVTIHIPAGVRIIVADAAGVDISGHEGDVEVHTTNGDVTIAKHVGAVDVHTSNGNVRIADSRSGRVAVETDNGRIGVENTTVGAIETHASNGRTTIRKIAFDGAMPSGTFVSDNGNVALDGNFPASGRYTASSSNGRILFAPQRDAHLTIAAHTSDGRVRVEYPGAVAVASDGDDDPSRTVRLGNGGGAVDLTTSNSRITISHDGASQ